MKLKSRVIEQKRILILVIACLVLFGLLPNNTLPSARASEPFKLGGQHGWLHDEGIEGGIFHTFDDLKIAGPNDLPRKVHLFLPRNYEKSSERFPVVYFNDGQTAFFRGGAQNKSLNVPNALSALYAQNKIRPVIAVAITPLNRSFEYSHEPALGQSCCGVELYTQYVAGSLKTFVDKYYRTLPGRAHTVVAGSSRGGLAAFYMATKRPDVFGNALSQSGSFWVGLDEPGQEHFTQKIEDSSLLKMAEPTLGSTTLRPRIYLDWGLVRTNGFSNFFIEERATIRGRELSNLLLSKFGYVQNETLNIVEDPQGGHEEDSWARRVGNALVFLLGKG